MLLADKFGRNLQPFTSLVHEMFRRRVLLGNRIERFRGSNAARPSLVICCRVSFSAASASDKTSSGVFSGDERIGELLGIPLLAQPPNRWSSWTNRL